KTPLLVSIAAPSEPFIAGMAIPGMLMSLVLAAPLSPACWADRAWHPDIARIEHERSHADAQTDVAISEIVSATVKNGRPYWNVDDFRLVTILAVAMQSKSSLAKGDQEEVSEIQ